MSTDFLADVSTAVDNGGNVDVASSPTVTKKAEQKPQPIRSVVKDSTDPAVSVNKIFDAASSDKATDSKTDATVTTDDKTGTKDKTATTTNPREILRKPNVNNNGARLLDTVLPENENGDLINSKGEVIAPKGTGRKYYEQLKNEGRQSRAAAEKLAVSLASLSEKFKDLYHEHVETSGKSTSPIQSIVKETGVTEREATSAINLMKQYKADPIAAIKTLLTQAKSDGIDISKIGANISVDPATLKSSMQELLDERLKPISDYASQEQLQRSASQQAAAFLQQYPEARQFTKHISHAKQTFPDMSLAEIWLNLKTEILKQRDKFGGKKPTTVRKGLPINPQQQQLQRRKIAVPTVDFSKLSFQEIAQSILKDKT